MSESMITKEALAKGLKELTRKKSFEKITISDITEMCKLNRQTFYYHFKDKYELLNWIYYKEAISIFTKDLSFKNWDEKVIELLKIMKNEDYFYQTALKDSSNTEFQKYLFSVAKDIFCEIFDSIPELRNFNKEDKVFLAEFISYGFEGMIIAWAKSGMKQSPEDIAQHIGAIIYGGKALAVSRYFQELNEQKQK